MKHFIKFKNFTYESTTSSCSCSHTNSLEKRYRLSIWTNILFCSLKKKTIKIQKTLKYIQTHKIFAHKHAILFFRHVFKNLFFPSCLSTFSGNFWVISRTVNVKARDQKSNLLMNYLWDILLRFGLYLKNSLLQGFHEIFQIGITF